jgi:PST family polysaccharide transporter
VTGPGEGPVPHSRRSPPGQRELDRSLVTGIAWTGSAKWLTQIVSWVSSILVARLLTPSDFGIVGLAGIYLGFANLVSTFGLGAAVIQRRHLDARRIAEIGGVSIALGFALFAVSAMLAWPVAVFFHEPRARDVIIVLGGLFVIGGVTILPRSLLTRDFQFRDLALLDTVEAIVQAVAALVLALLGSGYWALVWNQVIARLVGLALTLRLRRHEVRWPARLADIGSELRFGWRFVTSQVAWYWYSNADFLVVGRMLGTSAVGVYSLGWQLATLPVERVSALLSSVTPPLLSAIQKDRVALRRYFGGMTRALAFVTLPMSIGLLLTGDRFVMLLLGHKWAEAVLPLQILAAYAGFRAIATLYGLVLMYTGEERRAMLFNLVLAAVMPVLFVLGTRWGPAGVALAWVVGYPVIAVGFFLRTTLRVAGMSWRDYGRQLWKAAAGTAIMGVLVVGARWVTPEGVSPTVALTVPVVTGAIAYLAFLRVACVEDARALVRIVRGSGTP